MTATVLSAALFFPCWVKGNTKLWAVTHKLELSDLEASAKGYAKLKGQYPETDPNVGEIGWPLVGLWL